MGRAIRPRATLVLPDPAATQPANALRATILAFAAVLVVAAVILPLEAAMLLPRALFAGGVLLAFGAAIFLVHRGRVKAAAALFSLTILVGLALVACFSGGIRSPVLPLFPLAVVISGLYLGPRGHAVVDPLTIGTVVLLEIAASQGALPAAVLPASPLALVTAGIAAVLLAGTALSLSRRLPLDLVPGTRRRHLFLVEQTARLQREIEQRQHAEVQAAARTRSMLAASRMAVRCATAAKDADPFRLIAEEIHAVTGAVSTVVSSFDPGRSTLRVRHLVLPPLLRGIADAIYGGDPSATEVRVPPELGATILKNGVMETTDLSTATFGSIPPAMSFALKKALGIDRFTGIWIADGESVLATVLMGFPRGVPFLDPEVVEIFSTVSTMLLRETRAWDFARATEARFQEMVDQLPQPFMELDRHGIVQFANEKAREVFGIVPGSGPTGGTALDVVTPGQRPAILREFAAICAGRPQARSEFTLLRADGRPFEAVIRARPIVQDGRVQGVRGVVADISSVRRAEEQARESQRMLQLVLDLIPQSIFWKDTRSVYRGSNRTFVERTGLPGPEAVAGLTDADLPWASMAEALREIDREVMRTGTPRLNYLQPTPSLDGTVRQMRLSKLPMRNASGEIIGILAFAEDVTERVKGEEERALLTTAIEQAVESVVITDGTGAIEYVNPAFVALYGYGRDEVLGKNPRLLKSGVHDPDFYRELWEVLSAGRVWHGRFSNRTRDGSTVIEEAIISPVLDHAGGISRYVKVARDVSYETQLEQRYQQAQKMEAVGRLAGGVAHDFNNILTVISGYSELLAAAMERDGRWREEIAAISDAAARASGLTGQLLAFSRKQKLDPQLVDLGAVVRGIEPMLRRLIGEDIELATELAPALGAVWVDKGQIEQVILNLAVNARDAMPRGGRLSISARQVQAAPPSPHGSAGARPSDHVVLEVSDTGTGMSEEVRAHLFEPFFTTKPEHKGTGLGLATVYGIVTQSGGYIDVDSRPGEGARFQIFLPVAVSHAPVRAETSSTAGPSRGGERILLVEDDPAIRRLLARSLRGFGYTVEEAADPARAAALFRERPGEFQLLVSDVIMPTTSGPELASSLATLQPGLKVLFISGYTANETVEYGVDGREINLLQKPFGMQELARRVRRALDGR